MISKPNPTIAIRLKSTLLWTIMSFYTIFIFIVSLFIIKCDPRFRHRMIITWTWLFNWCARNICGVKYEVLGMDNILSSPSIIASNHQSMWETLCFCQIFPQHVWVLKKELLSIPFFGWALRVASPIGINRDTGAGAMAEVLKQGVDRFKRGFWILTFPEGTRLMPGERKKYKLGTARLALLLNANILPVAHNAGICYPRTGLCLYPGVITVSILPSISVEDHDINELTSKIETIINTELSHLNS